MTTTLFTGGRIRTLVEDQVLDWALVDGDRIVEAGAQEQGAPDADRTIDLDGGVLIPAFCDAHVHLPATGLYESGLDFRGETSAEAILEAYRQRASDGRGILFGGNFEDPLDRPLTRRDLDAVVGGRAALLARADMHSCIVSSALLERLDVGGLPGVDIDEAGEPTGYLREQAAAEAWRWFDANLDVAEQKEAIRAAARRCYSKGVARVNEMYVVEWRGWASMEVIADVAGELALQVDPYVATTDIQRVLDLGLGRIGGDWFLDGSFGSHTAWLSEPYEPPPPEGSPATGISYRSDEQVIEFFTEAQRAGLQTGVHAIGDAAIEQALRCWESVAQSVGLDAVRRLRHRIEHFECASDNHIERAVRLNLGASIQPAFDAFWGGQDGLYARRMGWDRARVMNRFKSMAAAGLAIGAGSDSTVTPLDPFLQMAALRMHHLESERFDGLGALAAHTIGSNALTRSEHRLGTIGPSMVAHLAWLDRDPVETPAGELEQTEVLGTWVFGVRVWPKSDAESD